LGRARHFFKSPIFLFRPFSLGKLWERVFPKFLFWLPIGLALIGGFSRITGPVCVRAPYLCFPRISQFNPFGGTLLRVQFVGLGFFGLGGTPFTRSWGVIYWGFLFGQLKVRVKEGFPCVPFKGSTLSFPEFFPVCTRGIFALNMGGDFSSFVAGDSLEVLGLPPVGGFFPQRNGGFTRETPFFWGGHIFPGDAWGKFWGGFEQYHTHVGGVGPQASNNFGPG